MDQVPKQCSAPSTSCGSPSGWRQGGQCWKCRTAHNIDLARRRGLTDTQRSDILAALNSHSNPAEAAATAGVPVRRVFAAAAGDGELRAALDGRSPAEQKAAHFGDYLAALTRVGGDVAMALSLSRLAYRELDRYRDQEATFRVAEEAVREWLATASVGTRGRQVSARRVARAIALLRSGATVTQAARGIGMASASGLRSLARRHPQLQTALPAPVNRGRRSRLRTPANERTLRERWPDLRYTVEEIAGELGTSGGYLAQWAADLGMPARNVQATRKTRSQATGTAGVAGPPRVRR